MTDKRRKVQLIFMSFIILLNVPAQLLATDEGSGEPWAFLKIGAGARAMGLGGAYVAIADDATATYWNPAGLGFLKKKFGLTFMHIEAQAGNFGPTVSGIAGRYEYISVAGPMPWGNLGNFGASVNYFNIGGIQYTTGASELDFQRISNANQQDTEIAYTLSYGRSIQRWFAFGSSIRFMRQQFFEIATNSWGLDFGFIMKRDRLWRISNLRGGYVFQTNFSRGWNPRKTWEDEFGSFFQLSDDKTHNTEEGFSNWRFGWAFDPIFKRNVTWTMASALVNRQNDSPLTLSIGTEWLFYQSFALRFGINDWRIHRRGASNATWETVKYRGTPTVGIGIIVPRLPLQIDYAVSWESLAVKHRISSTLSW